MTPIEAIKRLPNGLIAVSCIEYDDIFIFQAIPDEYKHEDLSEISDCLYSVDKSTGVVDVFDPTSMPADKFRSGKNVDISVENSNFLEHYGVLGMKWGVRRSPEELGRKFDNERGQGATKSSDKKKSTSSKSKNKGAFTKRSSKKALKAKQRLAKARAKAEKRRKEILNNPSKLYKHRKEFSKAEIDEAMKQFEWEKKLKQLSVDDVRLGAEKAQQYLNLAGKVVGGYNLTAQIYNTFKDPSAKALPYIEKKEEKKDDKKK